MAKHNNDSRQNVQRVLRFTLGEKLICLSLIMHIVTLIKLFLCL